LASFFNELNKIEKGNLKPVYLLLGDDFFLRQKILNALYKSFDCDEREIFYGKVQKSQKDEIDRNFLEELYSVGLFSSTKIVIYKDIDKIKKKYQDRLLKYFASIDKNILLILTTENKNALIKKLGKKAHQIKVYTPFPKYYPEYVNKFVKRQGYQIKPDARELLIAETDDSLSHTFAELEKVTVGLDKGATITVDDIKEIVGGEKQYQIYDFLDAIGNKNYYQAINICMILIKNGAKIPYLIIMLYNRFLDIWAYYQIHHPGKDKKSYFRQKQLDKLQKSYNLYKKADFEYIFTQIRKADLMGKSSSLKPKEVIIPLIIRIIDSSSTK